MCHETDYLTSRLVLAAIFYSGRILKCHHFDSLIHLVAPTRGPIKNLEDIEISRIILQNYIDI